VPGLIGGSTETNSSLFSGTGPRWLGMKTGLATNDISWADSPLPVGGTLSNFTILIVNESGLAAGGDITFTVLKNGADTAATCTLTNAQIPFAIAGSYPMYPEASCSDSTDSVGFAAGEKIAVKITATASVPNGFIVNWAAAYAS
jgi:hypothetical protein